MSSDTSEPQIVEEKNSDESQFECIPEYLKDNNSSTSGNVISSNSSNEEQNDKEIIEATKQELITGTNENKEPHGSLKASIQQGYKIINNSNSSGSDSNDNSQEDEGKVTFTEKIKTELASSLKMKIIEQIKQFIKQLADNILAQFNRFIRKVQQNPKVQEDMPEYLQDNIYEFEHIFQEIFQENPNVQKLNGEAIEVIIMKPLHDVQAEIKRKKDNDIYWNLNTQVNSLVSFEARQEARILLQSL